MQAVALAKLDMHKDAADMLSEAVTLEEKKQKVVKVSWVSLPSIVLNSFVTGKCSFYIVCFVNYDGYLNIVIFAHKFVE